MAKTPTRVFVLPIKGREAEIKALKALIKEAGCEVICDQAPASQWEKCLLEADVLVILICEEIIGDATVEKLVATASHEARRIVGVWSANTKVTTIPDPINEHGDAFITMDPGQIKDSICGGKAIWLTPEGKPRATPKTPRHKG